MNCNLFEEKYVAIARGELLDAETKQEALNHAESCSLCDERLQNEAVLNARLKEFAVAFSETSASTKVENALRDAFRANIAKQNETVLMMPQRRQRGAWVIGGAIAASLLIAFGLFAQSFSLNQNDFMSVVLTADEFIEPDTPLDIDELEKFILYEPVQNNLPSHKEHYAKADNKRSLPKQETKNEISQFEITTEFVSLTQDGMDSLPTNGQIVRVKLPRSALIAFGLPINMERANEKITADVMLSEEGIARAIRFVHTTD